jgi:hypothetical protein
MSGISKNDRGRRPCSRKCATESRDFGLALIRRLYAAVMTGGIFFGCGSWSVLVSGPLKDSYMSTAKP